jgi:hypothetical protein
MHGVQRHKEGCEVETTSDRVTTGRASLLIGGGLLPHHIDRLCRNKRIPFERIGRLRLILISDLPAVREAAVSAGYIQPGEPAHAAH